MAGWRQSLAEIIKPGVGGVGTNPGHWHCVDCHHIGWPCAESCV